MSIPRYADLPNLTVHELTELCRLYNRLDPESKKAKAIQGRLNSIAFILSENGFLVWVCDRLLLELVPY